MGDRVTDLSAFEDYVNSIGQEPADELLSALLTVRDELEDQELLQVISRPAVVEPVTVDELRPVHLANSQAEWDTTDLGTIFIFPVGCLAVLALIGLVIAKWLL